MYQAISRRRLGLSWAELVIKDVFMKYRDGLPNVLKGLSLHIRGGERIGIGLISYGTS